MNHLATDKRISVVAALVEGNSINATCRMTGVAKHTVLKLLKDLGCACAAYHDEHVRNLRVRRAQADEIWAFVYAKQKNVTAEQMEQGAGDVWTWTAIDADTKLTRTPWEIAEPEPLWHSCRTWQGESPIACNSRWTGIMCT